MTKPQAALPAWRNAASLKTRGQGGPRPIPESHELALFLVSRLEKGLPRCSSLHSLGI